MEIKPIGYIQSCYKEKFATPRQPLLVTHATSQLKVLPEFQPHSSLQDLEKFSHIWLLFIFHQNTNKHFHSKVHPPRLNGDSTGLFASRSPHRPNPIGLSLVKLDKIDKNILFFTGGDLIDGTPIVDIKPYIPSIEALPEAKESWISNRDHTCLKVILSAKAEEKISYYEQLAKHPHLRSIIFDTLSSDPRPLVYKTEQKIHAFRLYDLDVLFTVEEDRAHVLTLQPYGRKHVYKS